MTRIAISGFGRIGRNFLRAVLSDPKAAKHLDLVAINIGPANRESLAHMTKYDSLMGTYPGSISFAKDELIIDGKRIKILSEVDPARLPWKKLKIDWVVESSGHFTTREGAQKHLDAGAKAVLITAPGKDEDASIIMGLNQKSFNSKKDKIVSLGSCTTNAVIPMLKVMQDTFGISTGSMTTIHAYTNSQVLLDEVEGRDLRMARAAAINIIPTTTGAMKMLSKVMPELAGKINGIAIRVPVAKVSLIDLAFVAQKRVTVEEIHAACKKAAAGPMKNIMHVSMEPLVSSDYAGSSYSVIIDGLLTNVQGNLANIFGWYDNEWAYSVRLKDFLLYTTK
jgi:glyceraldehyde 3-phosphate dehydrogenase